MYIYSDRVLCSQLTILPSAFHVELSQAATVVELGAKKHIMAPIHTGHVSRRAGTLLVGARFDKSELEYHHIEGLDTYTIEHLKKTPDDVIILIP